MAHRVIGFVDDQQVRRIARGKIFSDFFNDDFPCIDTSRFVNLKKPALVARQIGLAKPFGRIILRSFAAQDGGAVAQQSAVLKYGPQMTLVGDGDMQARWYQRLKREYARACAEGRKFVNPVQPRVLRFRS